MKKGIIFDMDGTLWDSAVNVAKSWDIAIENYGYKRDAITEEEMQSVMGKTMDDIAKILFPNANEKELCELQKACCDYENEYLSEHGGVLYDNLRITMEKLHDMGYHTYIVSNCQSGYIEAFLDFYGFWDLFEDIECFGNTNQGKAYNIKLLNDRNELDKACYVGDIQGDYDATTKAGLPFIHAKYGFGTIDTDVPFITSLENLIEVIENVI